MNSSPDNMNGKNEAQPSGSKLAIGAIVLVLLASLLHALCRPGGPLSPREPAPPPHSDVQSKPNYKAVHLPPQRSIDFQPLPQHVPTTSGPTYSWDLPLYRQQ